MSSKKKRRHAEYLKREAKRRSAKAVEAARREAIESGDIEKLSAALGVKLR